MTLVNCMVHEAIHLPLLFALMDPVLVVQYNVIGEFNGGPIWRFNRGTSVVTSGFFTHWTTHTHTHKWTCSTPKKDVVYHLIVPRTHHSFHLNTRHLWTFMMSLSTSCCVAGILDHLARLSEEPSSILKCGDGWSVPTECQIKSECTGQTWLKL